MVDEAKLKAQANFFYTQAMGRAQAAGLLPADDPKKSPRNLAHGAAVAILGAEAVAGGFVPPSAPHISTERAARAHAKANAAKSDDDIDRIIWANRRRREKARRQAKGVKL